MDGHAQTAWRNWLLGTAAAGCLCPGLALGQTVRPVTKTAPPPVKPAVQVRPTADPISRPASGVVQASDSEIQQRLRELYERDGREMPNMQLSPAQSPQAALPAASRQAPAMQPRYSEAPRVAPTAARPNENRVSSFFKKLVPGGNKKSQAQVPAAQPQQLPTPISHQPVIQPAPTAQATPAAIQPQFRQQPQAAAPIRAQLSPPAPITAPPAALVPPSPAALIQENQAFELPAKPQAEDDSETLDLPEINDESLAAPAFGDDLDDDFEEEMEAAPTLPASPSAVDDFPDPFGEQADAADETAPQLPAETPAEEASPYTGKTLDSDEPAKISADEFLPPLERAGNDNVTDETTASKMRRIIQRSDMKGLKGFCPVTLRDQRELADSRPEFSSSHRGQKFFFASKVALSKFEQDPARYAPAAYGADVVVLTEDQDVVEGTLDFAAWYKGRLYLFGTQTTHDKFISQPDKYASPPGIE